MPARQALFAEFGFELGAVLGVRVRQPLQADVFTGREFRKQAQDGAAVFRVAKGDALDRAGEIAHVVSINYPVVTAPMLQANARVNTVWLGRAWICPAGE